MLAGAKRRSPDAVLVVMCVGYFLILLDVTIVNVALPEIASGTGAGVSGLQWVVDGYALALASLMLVGGAVGDLRGHRRVVLCGLAVFGLGSLGCGLAPGLGALVAGRVLQGIGAALLLPGTLAIVSRAFPEGRRQARAIGVWAGVGSLALPAGPLLGGALIALLGWRAIFLVNVPIVLLALPLAAALVEEDREAEPERRLDLAGVALGVALLATLTAGVIEAGRSGLGSAAAIVPLALAAGLLPCFLAVERRRGEGAMLPLGLLRHRGFSVANASAATMNLGTLGVLFVLTLFLQRSQGRPPLETGIALLPLFAPLAVIAPFAGRLVGRVGPRAPIAAGLLVAAAGLGLLGLAGPASSYLSMLPAFLLWGVGLGILTPAVVAAAVAAVPGSRAGLASSINNTARQAGGAIGIAIAGAVAGEPGEPGFLHGFHAVALGAALLYVLAAALGPPLMGGASEPSNRGAGLPMMDG
jgi:DHA2 family methylenomycin A resistance protein-like MFS transporter